jgi:hypothetical protein
MSSFLSDSTRKIDLISQGTYGCIFKPGMNCKGEIEKEGYITKIQYDQETTQNEVDIGKILLNNSDLDPYQDPDQDKKKDYEERFAPILDSCSISLGLIKDDFIEKCKVIKDNALANHFYSNRIRYVGKYTLFDYFSMLIQESNKSKFMSFCSQFHIYLLDSVLLLKEKNIIHFDLKENNILINQKRNVPVIIDFGLSISMDLLLKKPMDPYLYTKTFYAYYDKYPPWCLEIVLISFIVSNVSVNSIWGGGDEKKSKRRKPKKIKESDFVWISRIVKKEDLLSIVDHYFEENPVLKMISLDTRKKYKNNWNDWIQKIYTDKKSTVFGMFMVNKLIEAWTTWDTFGLSVIFFRLLHKFIPNRFLEYQNILIENMLAIPTERKGPDVLKNRLTLYFRSQNVLQENKNWIHSTV